MQIVCKFYLCNMITKPTINVWLDNRREKKDHKFPVKIRITHQRQRFYYPTNISLTESEFLNALSSKPGFKLKETHLKLNELERQANDTVDKIVDELHMEFTIGLFEKYLYINTTDYNDLFKCFDRKIKLLTQRDQVKTAGGYETAKNALQKYTGKNQLSFAEVDSKFLEGFEMYMLKEKCSLTTVGVYTRYLRSIFNEAIQEKIVNAELYPFGKNQYQIPQSANNKRALSPDALAKIFNHKPEENSWEEYARDMWMLSLLCQGMNMKDIANLRYKNLMGDKLVFTREKTKRTKRTDQRNIIVYLSKEAKDIIKKWGREDKSPNHFVFKIYEDDNTALRNLRLVEQQTKMINKYIRMVAAKLKIKGDVTFYAARHSFATSLKRQGRSAEEIKEFLGHSNIKTTERYLASFGDDHNKAIIKDFVKGLKKA